MREVSNDMTEDEVQELLVEQVDEAIRNLYLDGSLTPGARVALAADLASFLGTERDPDEKVDDHVSIAAIYETSGRPEVLAIANTMRRLLEL